MEEACWQLSEGQVPDLSAEQIQRIYYEQKRADDRALKAELSLRKYELCVARANLVRLLNDLPGKLLALIRNRIGKNSN